MAGGRCVDIEPAISTLIRRDAEAVLHTLLAEEPALLIEGPRGSGKSTIIRQIAQTRSAHVIDLDDDGVASVVREDPEFALAQDGLVVIDEFQRAPAVLSAIKRAVDARSSPGRFLLAGSVSASLLPTGSETLTGRVHRLVLPPLGAGELLRAPTRLIPALLAGNAVPATRSKLTRADYFQLVAAGGYPAALRRSGSAARRRWFASYLASVAERDIPQLADVRHPGVLPRLYRLVAEQTSDIIARSTIAQQLGLSTTTTAAYLDLLRHVHLLRELPSWTIGVSSKVGRRPKMHVVDTGLAVASLGFDGRRLAGSALAGGFLESYVLAEVAQQAGLIDEPVNLAHFRDRSGIEVDLLLERSDGSVIGIEVKSATSVNQTDGKGLRFLRDRLGDRFAMGLVLYTGQLSARLGDRVWATPVSALWGGSGFAESGGTDAPA